MSENYYNSFDQGLAKFHQGNLFGFQEGIAKGFGYGQNQGYEIGYQAGYDACVDAANAEIQKCMGYIRQHVADKKGMSEQIATQHALILQMKAMLDLLAQENQQQRELEQKLRQCIK